MLPCMGIKPLTNHKRTPTTIRTKRICTSGILGLPFFRCCKTLQAGQSCFLCDPVAEPHEALLAKPVAWAKLPAKLSFEVPRARDRAVRNQLEDGLSNKTVLLRQGQC
jgi:hypothetical protein